MQRFLILMFSLLLLLPGEAVAHVGVGESSGLAGGIMHPFSGQWTFMAGFLAATVLLHMAGVLIGMVQTKAITLRLSGAAIASVGILLSVASIS